jgi:hypothetical protein
MTTLGWSLRLRFDLCQWAASVLRRRFLRLLRKPLAARRVPLEMEVDDEMLAPTEN